jgi:hypothetical protein
MVTSAIFSSRPVQHIGQALLLGACFVGGYLVAGWWSGNRDATPLERICARVDYINGLQQEIEGQDARPELRNEFNSLVEECRAALRNRTEEND